MIKEQTGIALAIKKSIPVTRFSLGERNWPRLITQAGPAAEERFIEFFTATIRNSNTREAYFRAISRFLAWAEQGNLELAIIRPVHVAAYIEGFTKELSTPYAKQHLAAIRMLFDWLVTGQIVSFNPTAAVRGPRYSAKKGKTPVLAAAEARATSGINSSRLCGWPA